jgi:hypothetical protein
VSRRRSVAVLLIALASTLAVPLVAGGAEAATQTEQIRLSVSSAGAQVNGGGSKPAASADGNIVAFQSLSNQLAPNDNNFGEDVFVRNQAAGTTTLASITLGGTTGNAPAFDASISNDGHLVTFTSVSNGYVAGDTNGTDVFVRDLTAGTTVRASVTNAGAQANGNSSLSAISGDGTKVAFSSTATNLVAGDTNGKSDVFVRDLVAGTTTRVSVTPQGVQGDGASIRPSLSDNGSVVAFESDATNLSGTDTNGRTDVLVRTGTAAIRRISIPTSGAQANGASIDADVSGTGFVVAFSSAASNLIVGDTNGATDVFTFLLPLNTLTQVSHPLGAPSNGPSANPSISTTGAFVAFSSNASNLVPGDTNNNHDVFVSDQLTTTLSMVSVRTANAEGNGLSSSPALAGTGSLIVFDSSASSLVNGDTNASIDVFRTQAKRCEGHRVTVDLNAGGVPGAGADVVRGTTSPDVVDLGAGSDRACMGAGNDRVTGGTGSDRIFGGIGLDTLSGQAGNDALFGEIDNDSLNGGADIDTCDGGSGTDTTNSTCETRISIP